MSANDLNTVLGYLARTPDGKIVLSGIDESVAVDVWPGYGQKMPQGEINSLSELRASFPNLEILPRLKPFATKIAANTVAEFAIPNETQFVIVSGIAGVAVSFEGRGNLPAIDTWEDGVSVIAPGSELKLYCGGSRSLTIRDLSGADNFVSVMCYITDKLVNI